MELNDQFLAKFKLPRDDFSEPTKLSHLKIGFSVFKGGNNSNLRSLFYVFIKNDEFGKPGCLKSLRVVVNYGKLDEDGQLIIASSALKPNIDWPIDVYSENEFFYDIKTSDLYFGTSLIGGVELLALVDAWHTKPRRSFLLRMKLRILRRWVIYIPVFFIKILYIVSGQRITENFWKRRVQQNTPTHNIFKKRLELTKPDKLNLFGYDASQWAVLFYCILHIGGFIVMRIFNIHVPLVSYIFSSNFFLLMYAIPTLVIVDRGLPNVLRYLINKSTDFAGWVLTRRIKI